MNVGENRITVAVCVLRSILGRFQRRDRREHLKLV